MRFIWKKNCRKNTFVIKVHTIHMKTYNHITMKGIHHFMLLKNPLNNTYCLNYYSDNPMVKQCLKKINTQNILSPTMNLLALFWFSRYTGFMRSRDGMISLPKVFDLSHIRQKWSDHLA